MIFHLKGKDNLIAKVMVVIDQEEVQQAFFPGAPTRPHCKKQRNFLPGSPLRILGEARWRGAIWSPASLLSSQAASGNRICSLNLGENDWIGWVDGKWSKVEGPSKIGAAYCPDSIISPQMLEWDVWDCLSYEACDMLCRRSSQPILRRKNG